MLSRTRYCIVSAARLLICCSECRSLECVTRPLSQCFSHCLLAACFIPSAFAACICIECRLFAIRLTVSYPRFLLAMGEEPNLCGTCLTVNNRKKTVTCINCGRCYHRTCVGLSGRQADGIPRWSCLVCLGRAIAPARVDEVDLVDYVSKCRAGRGALRIIPKGAAFCAADALQKLINGVVRDKTQLAWGKLLSFGFMGIGQPAPDSGSGRHGVSLTSKVKSQISAFMEDDTLPEPVRIVRDQESTRDVRLGRGVASKFADGDIKGAVRLLASSEDVAPNDDRTLGLLQQKHPPVPADLSLPEAPGEDYEPTVASEDDVRKALSSFGPGSAGGPDGLRPGHLKALTSRKTAEAGMRLLASLTEFVNLVLRGEVPEFARKVFYGASLCALGKKDGGVRPIAVGCTLRRLAAKVGARPLAAQIGDSLRPVQLGYSTKGGFEAATHAARRYLGGAKHRRVVFKVDMANAFNTIRRDVFLAAARVRARSLYRLLWQAYSGPSSLFFGETTLVSATGIQQGDPFGPALFSLGIDDLIRELDVELNIWYLDDGTLGDTPEKVILCVQELIEAFRGVGLDFNKTKCELLILDHTEEERERTEELFKEAVPGVKVVPKLESRLLGAPLTEEGVAAAIAEKKCDLERVTARLKLIENHQAFALLKSCFSLPKLQYILRASPAYRSTEILTEFDMTLVAALSTVTNVHFEGDSLVQAVLPVRLGGLGIRMSKDIALPAFISSLHASQSLVDTILCKVQRVGDRELEMALGVWNERHTGPALDVDADLSRQRTWDLPLAETTAAGLLERADQISRARLLAAGLRESGLWLHALPTPVLGTLLDSETFRVSIALRVGAEVCSTHTCRCGRVMDARGLHGLSCKYSAGRHPRHAALNEIVMRSLRSAGIPSILEPVGIDRDDGRRPHGITVFPFSNGRCLCWDATCVDTYASTHLNNAALVPGEAAKLAEERKRLKYAALAVRYRFEPISLETTGFYDGTTGTLLSEIGRRTTEVTGDPRETVWLEQRIGLAVQRGNAFSILASVRERYGESM